MSKPTGSRDCDHPDFIANVKVNRFEDSGGFLAELTVTCTRCKLPFQFLGLPLGLSFVGATMSADGREARLAIAPSDRVFHPLAGVTGFGVKAS